MSLVTHMKPSTNWYSGSTNFSIIAVVAAEALGEGLWRGWPAAVLDVMGLGGRAMTGLGGHSMSPQLLFSFQDFFFFSSSGRWACSYQAIRAGCWAGHRGPWWKQERFFPSLWTLPSKCCPPRPITQKRALGPLFTDKETASERGGHLPKAAQLGSCQVGI